MDNEREGKNTACQIYLIAVPCQLTDVCHVILSNGLQICQQVRLGTQLARLTKCPS